LGHFGRKIGDESLEKNILFCTFSRFRGLFFWKLFSVSIFWNIYISQKIVPKNLP